MRKSVSSAGRRYLTNYPMNSIQNTDSLQATCIVPMLKATRENKGND